MKALNLMVGFVQYDTARIHFNWEPKDAFHGSVFLLISAEAATEFAEGAGKKTQASGLNESPNINPVAQ